MLVPACVILSMPVHDISDAVSFTLPNHVDDILKQCYPKSYDEFSPAQPYINPSKAGGRPLRWIENALNKAPELPSFRTPFPDDQSLMHAHNHNRIRTAIQFAVGGARWIAG
jgi:hypothetical protein